MSDLSINVPFGEAGFLKPGIIAMGALQFIEIFCKGDFRASSKRLLGTCTILQLTGTQPESLSEVLSSARKNIRKTSIASLYSKKKPGYRSERSALASKEPSWISFSARKINPTR